MIRSNSSFRNSSVVSLQKYFVVACLLALLGTAFLVLTGNSSLPLSTAAHASQAAIHGEWTIQKSRSGAGEVQISFSRRADSFNMLVGDSVLIGELQGLSPADMLSSAKTNVSFSLAREAGTFACQGSFINGRGDGTWTFTPSSAFASSMKSRGYANLSDEDLLRAALHNLTTKYIEDLKSAGYDNLEFEQLSRGAGHDVSVAYIRELQSAGFTGLTMEQLIRARNHE